MKIIGWTIAIGFALILTLGIAFGGDTQATQDRNKKEDAAKKEAVQKENKKQSREFRKQEWINKQPPVVREIAKAITPPPAYVKQDEKKKK